MTKAQRRKEGNQVIATKPNDLFNYWRADEAAECLELPDETYSFLWIEIVPRQGKKEFHEDRVHEEKNLRYGDLGLFPPWPLPAWPAAIAKGGPYPIA